MHLFADTDWLGVAGVIGAATTALGVFGTGLFGAVKYFFDRRDAAALRAEQAAEKKLAAQVAEAEKQRQHETELAERQRLQDMQGREFASAMSARYETLADGLRQDGRETRTVVAKLGDEVKSLGTAIGELRREMEHKQDRSEAK